MVPVEIRKCARLWRARALRAERERRVRAGLRSSELEAKWLRMPCSLGSGVEDWGGGARGSRDWGPASSIEMGVGISSMDGLLFCDDVDFSVGALGTCGSGVGDLDCRSRSTFRVRCSGNH